jgi:uncharacterized phage-associated protein
MTEENEIESRSLNPAIEDKLIVSRPSVGVATGTGFSAPDSTQATRASMQSGKLQIAPLQTSQTAVSAHDVAAFIVQKQGEMTAMKLQKLVYYCQAWSLVWDEQPLFAEEIEAWANGPVVRSLYAQHKGNFKVSQWNGDIRKLSENQQDTILKVLEFYGPMPAQVLSDLTHNEEPWIKARKGLAVSERGSRIISHADMVEYYSSLA